MCERELTPDPLDVARRKPIPKFHTGGPVPFDSLAFLSVHRHDLKPDQFAERNVTPELIKEFFNEVFNELVTEIVNDELDGKILEYVEKDLKRRIRDLEKRFKKKNTGSRVMKLYGHWGDREKNLPLHEIELIVTMKDGEQIKMKKEEFFRHTPNDIQEMKVTLQVCKDINRRQKLFLHYYDPVVFKSPLMKKMDNLTDEELKLVENKVDAILRLRKS